MVIHKIIIVVIVVAIAIGNLIIVDCSSNYNDGGSSNDSISAIEFKNSTSGGYILIQYGSLKNEILNQSLNGYSQQDNNKIINIIANDTISCDYEFFNDTVIKIKLPNGIYSVDIKFNLNGREIYRTNIKYDRVSIENVSYFYTTGTFNLSISGYNFGDPYSIKIKQFNYGEELSNCTLLLSESNKDYDIITCLISINSKSNIDGITGDLDLYIGPYFATTTINFVNFYQTHHNDLVILVPIIILPCLFVLGISIVVMVYLKRRK